MTEAIPSSSFTPIIIPPIGLPFLLLLFASCFSHLYPFGNFLLTLSQLFPSTHVSTITTTSHSLTSFQNPSSLFLTPATFQKPTFHLSSPLKFFLPSFLFSSLPLSCSPLRSLTSLPQPSIHLHLAPLILALQSYLPPPILKPP